MGDAAGGAYIGRIYADHGAWLGRWLQRRTQCPHRAADLTHDTFRRLLERRDLPAIDDPRHFLATVARRLLTDDIRRRELERAYVAALACDGGADEITPERTLEAIDLLAGVAQILEGLPSAVCEAFLLRRLDGLSHDAVAARMGVSDRTVKRYVAQAYAHCYALAYPEG